MKLAEVEVARPGNKLKHMKYYGRKGERNRNKENREEQISHNGEGRTWKLERYEKQ